MGWRQCTYNYKVKVIDETIKRELFGLAPRQHVPPGFSCTNVTGLSWDEPMRVAKVRGKNCAWQTFECPLFDMQWTRAKCAAWLRDKVPHTVPRSACVFCPYHNNEEWRHIRDHDQEGRQRALTIDRALREDAACSRGSAKRCICTVRASPRTRRNRHGGIAQGPIPLWLRAGMRWDVRSVGAFSVSAPGASPVVSASSRFPRPESLRPARR